MEQLWLSKQTHFMIWFSASLIICVYEAAARFFFQCSSNAITHILAPVSKRKEQFKLSVYSLHLSYVYSIWCEAQGHLALGQQPEDIHL